MLAFVSPPLIALALAALALAAMLAVPLRRPPPFASISEGAKMLDMTDMPALARYPARDGARLAYRLYPGESARVAILVHGSSALSDEMNGMAKAFAAVGVTAVAPDIRGHGASGRRGDIGYPGQLEHDLADLLAHLEASRPGARFVLVGHSLGAGFAARISATPLGARFERFVLVAPFLGPRAPTSGPGNRRWASADVPRIVALDILRRLRLPFGERLPVIAFGTDPAAAAYLTPVYSFRLLADFGPDFDWRKTKAALAAAARKIAVVAAGRDDLMDAAAMQRELTPLGVQVTVLPEVDHMQTCVEPPRSRLSSQPPDMDNLKSAVLFALAEFGPLLAFWALLLAFNVKVAIAGSLILILVDGAWRLYRRRPFTRLYLVVSALTLAFGAVDLCVATPFLLVYEAPITNVLVGAAFFAGAFGETPLVMDLALARPGADIPRTQEMRRFFRIFTLLWAAYQFLKAAFYLWLATTMPLQEALALRSLLGGISLAIMIALSVTQGRRLFFLCRRLGLLGPAVAAEAE